MLFREFSENAKEATLSVILEGKFSREVEKVSLKRDYTVKGQNTTEPDFRK